MKKKQIYLCFAAAAILALGGGYVAKRFLPKFVESSSISEPLEEEYCNALYSDPRFLVNTFGSVEKLMPNSPDMRHLIIDELSNPKNVVLSWRGHDEEGQKFQYMIYKSGARVWSQRLENGVYMSVSTSPLDGDDFYMLADHKLGPHDKEAFNVSIAYRRWCSETKCPVDGDVEVNSTTHNDRSYMKASETSAIIKKVKKNMGQIDAYYEAVAHKLSYPVKRIPNMNPPISYQELKQ